jgi:hypothetical protein
MKSGLLMQNLQFTGYMPDLSALRQRPAIVGTGCASVKVIAASRQVLVALAVPVPAVIALRPHDAFFTLTALSA